MYAHTVDVDVPEEGNARQPSTQERMHCSQALTSGHELRVDRRGASLRSRHGRLAWDGVCPVSEGEGRGARVGELREVYYRLARVSKAIT